MYASKYYEIQLESAKGLDDRKDGQMNGDSLLTSAELAKYLRIRRETVVRKARKGELPSIKIGRQFRFDKSQIKGWIKERQRGDVPHILVVDDDAGIRKLFQESLEEIGINVITARNGSEAINLITQNNFDLAFIDLKLPVVDGTDLLAWIRDMNRELPVIVITEYPNSDLMEKALQHGPLTLLKKPFGQEEILNAVRFLIGDVARAEMH